MNSCASLSRRPILSKRKRSVRKHESNHPSRRNSHSGCGPEDRLLCRTAQGMKRVVCGSPRNRLLYIFSILSGNRPQTFRLRAVSCRGQEALLFPYLSLIRLPRAGRSSPRALARGSPLYARRQAESSLPLPLSRTPRALARGSTLGDRRQAGASLFLPLRRNPRAPARGSTLRDRLKAGSSLLRPLKPHPAGPGPRSSAQRPPAGRDKLASSPQAHPAGPGPRKHALRPPAGIGQASPGAQRDSAGFGPAESLFQPSNNSNLTYTKNLKSEYISWAIFETFRSCGAKGCRITASVS